MIRILVVDDDSLVRDLMRDYIREHMKDTDLDYEVVVAGDGLQALDVLKAQTTDNPRDPGFDLIFLDVRMPGLSGVGVYEWIKENRPSLVPRVCFVTGYMGDLEPYLDPSEITLLKKPFRLDEMRSRLAAHIRMD